MISPYMVVDGFTWSDVTVTTPGAVKSIKISFTLVDFSVDFIIFFYNNI